jgi:hypothetical protein
MESSGTKPAGPTRRNFTLLAVRTLLALFVAWGSIVVVTRSFVLPFPVAIKDYWPEMRNCRYTVATVKFTQRGWPAAFYVKTGLPTRRSPFHEGIRPAALLYDMVVSGIVVVAAWNLFGPFRRQFSLADMFAVTTSVAMTLSFHLIQWGRCFQLSEFAVDVGAFCVAFSAIRAARKLAARLPWPRRRLEPLG